MRVLPSAPVTCFVCGSTFTVQNRMEMKDGKANVHPEPSACPFCEAPLLAIPELNVGIAKGLLLTHAGAPEEKKAYRTVARYLEQFTRTEAEIDTLLKLAREFDFDAWEALNRRLLQHDKDAGLKMELKFIPKLRKEAEDGGLLEQLQRAAAPVKDAYRARWNHHMAIFRQRKPS
ncbi:hypothetical protein D7X96_29175 [Corallococcus interemptor]|uniref:Uncharacterized protein n=1 Tax=Corallococcus interemptor TaxID=2316720 RepID=A0A3A8Q5L6_9BACT|nr:hypothetical protein [Corallococcus interemptor]RKH62781.1 hypothetical protein D7X96_29175 [Corallococcus interemptor]